VGQPDDVPVIDITPLVTGVGDTAAVARDIDAACREFGFFAISGHGVDRATLDRLIETTHAFFALPTPVKEAVAMARGGRAWRGWFPLGGELTSGRPDAKEGYYFGRELPADDQRPLHGPNLWPAEPAALRPLVLAWMGAMERLAQTVLRGVAEGLGLDPEWFARELTADPVVLFRAFRYPPLDARTDGATDSDFAWSVGEHTDYGLLTLLAQDDTPGLEVRIDGTWRAVPAARDLIVCNLGDMLDRMTDGRYRSTTHRVRNSSGHDRLSFPFFCDPGWDTAVQPVPAIAGDPPPDDAATRWDNTSLRTLSGTYGDYLWSKVQKVFPALSP
jgi:isopenicillin N synthase-like dioxygenase